VNLLNDQALLHDHLSCHYRRLPHVFLGLSMGGLLAAQFAAALSRKAPAAPWTRPMDGVVLIAPALAPTLPGPQSATLTVLHRMVPDLPVSLDHMQSWGSSDPAVLAAKRADPLMHTRLTPRTVQFMLQTAKQVQALADEDWTVPTLLSFTDRDRLVPAEVCARFAERLPPALLHTVRYSDMAHDLLHEPCADELGARIVTWLDAIR
jgi:lysophospholipase